VRVLHLVGSPTSDFFVDLSLVYARGCLAATADPTRYDVVIALVQPDGRWRFPAELSPAGIAAAEPVEQGAALSHLADLQVDVAVPQLFCLPGMTTYRSLLDLLGIPFVGNPPDVMALTAHKARAKAVVSAAGVAVPEGEVLHPGQPPTLALPVMVKPVDGDNSVGTSLVRSAGELAGALGDAFLHSDEVLVERYVELGREVRCGVLERAGELVCLPLEEYAVSSIRGAADKLQPTDGGVELVAKQASRAWIVDDADPVTGVVWDAALSCHRALGCRDHSLFDFRIDPGGRPWFLEAGLYCSFSPSSVVATMAAAAGLPLADLYAEQLARAVSRG